MEVVVCGPMVVGRSGMLAADLPTVMSALFACMVLIMTRVFIIVRRAHRQVQAVSTTYSRQSKMDEQNIPGVIITEQARDASGVIDAPTAAELADTVMGVAAPTAADLADTVMGVAADEDQQLCELRSMWLEQVRPKFLPGAAADPYLSPPDVDALLLRFLNAERGDRKAERREAAGGTGGLVQRTAARLSATAAFRAEYACTEMHRKGMARKLIMHATNAGASVYFGDCGLRNRQGVPVLLGRQELMTNAQAPGRRPSDDMLPAQHIRAALLVCERSAVELYKHGVGAKGYYILDVGNYPAKEMAPFAARFWDEDGAGVAAADGTVPCVGPSLPGHHELKGLAVLKESLRLLERYYPETMGRIFFYRPGLGFRAVFAIFRLWVPKSSRDRFILVREGEERKFFEPPPHGAGLDPATTPRELGGTGPSLEGDRFLLRAVERYEREALFE